jgi:hypothetical protein
MCIQVKTLIQGNCSQAASEGERSSVEADAKDLFQAAMNVVQEGAPRSRGRQVRYDRPVTYRGPMRIGM